MQQFRSLLNNTINKACSCSYFNLIVFITAVIAIVVRIFKVTKTTFDIKHFIEPWFNKINTKGFIASFSNPTWDYSFLYPYLLYIKSLFFDEFNIVVIKLISIGFDFLMAFYSYRILKLIIDKKMAILFTLLFLCIPTQWMNSGTWGQIDGMMHAFFTISFYYLLTGKYSKAIFFFSLTTIIKTTFVFFLPFLGIYWIVNRFPLRYFLIIPEVYSVAAIPSLLAGLPLDQMFYSFTKQTSVKFSSKLFNIHAILGLNDYSLFKSWRYGSILCTFLLLVFLTLVIWKKRDFILQKNTKEKSIFWLLTLAIILILLPLLLPHMHARYYYFATMTIFLYTTLTINYFTKRHFLAWIPFVALETSSIIIYFRSFGLTYLDFLGLWKNIIDAQIKYFLVPLIIIGLYILYRDFYYLLKNNVNTK